MNETIEKIGRILKNVFSIEVFNLENSYGIEVAEKIVDSIKEDFVININVEDVIKKAYGKDAKLVIESIRISEVPSRIKELINIKKSNADLILNLSDLGYLDVQIKYYVKQSSAKQPIYIGTNAQKSIKKYEHPISIVGYMNKIEETFGVSLIPNLEHTELIYGKEYINPMSPGVSYPPGYFMPADFENYTTVLQTAKVYKAVKTKTGITICSDIDCEHKNGYSIDLFNITFNYKNKAFIDELKDIPNDVIEKLRKVYITQVSQNEEVITGKIIACLKNEIKNLVEAFNKCCNNNFQKSLYNDYKYFISGCKNLKIDVPSFSSQESVEVFLNSIDALKTDRIEEFDRIINSIKHDIDDNYKNEEIFQQKINEIIQEVELEWDDIYYSKQPSGFDTKGKATDLFLYFSDMLNKKNAPKICLESQIKSLKRDIGRLKNGGPYDYYYDIDNPQKHELSAESVENLVSIVENNLNFCNAILEGKYNFELFDEKLTEKFYNTIDERDKVIYSFNYISEKVKNIQQKLSIYISYKNKAILLLDILNKLKLICNPDINLEYEQLQSILNLFEDIIKDDILNRYVDDCENKKYVNQKVKIEKGKLKQESQD